MIVHVTRIKSGRGNPGPRVLPHKAAINSLMEDIVTAAEERGIRLGQGETQLSRRVGHPQAAVRHGEVRQADRRPV